jgi:hypothetical protein
MRRPGMTTRRFRLWMIFVVIAVLAVLLSLWVDRLRDTKIQRALVRVRRTVGMVATRLAARVECEFHG